MIVVTIIVMAIAMMRGRKMRALCSRIIMVMKMMEPMMVNQQMETGLSLVD
jgi:hypothetical protein